MSEIKLKVELGFEEKQDVEHNLGITLTNFKEGKITLKEAKDALLKDFEIANIFFES
jgi:hypothetical protein